MSSDALSDVLPGEPIPIPSVSAAGNVRVHAHTPASVPFASLLDLTDIAAGQRRDRRRALIIRIIAALCIVVAIVASAIPAVLQWRSSAVASRTAAETEREVRSWVPDRRRDALAAARRYNAALAADGQPVLGEPVDPFSASASGGLVDYKDAVSTKDDRYQSLLDAGGGVMGRVRVPKQSIDLPIYHGTSAQVLARGAGHLYGTSLPVGGKSTHAVLTGHRGLVEALMFTRLDEMHEGDYFYIDVMGKTLTYRVDRISVIEPDDTSLLKIVRGEDRVTLMTCTPYRLNTHRLLVSGVRVPDRAAPAAQSQQDRRLALGQGIVVVGGVLAALLLGAGVWLRRRYPDIEPRHAAQ
ncbi:sortase family protein [Bifidobacterium leontopitheci]|uniref:Sortase family protein n=2 Tax=Bifidobacterium leontopitheci TaxID=2650774 RepID=A0A6I1GLY5_9BIFI|nr:sortase family protein [Bifidobacterium leontopitheci]